MENRGGEYIEDKIEISKRNEDEMMSSKWDFILKWKLEREEK